MTDKTDNQEADSNKPTKNSKGSTEENLSKPALVTKSHDAAPDPTDPAKEASARQGTSTLFNAKPIPKMTAKRTSRGRVIPYIIALLLVVALLLTGWTTYQQKLFQERWTELQDRVNHQIDQQAQTIQQMTKSTDLSHQAINRAERQVSQLSSDNQRLKESLLSTQERIKSLSGRQKQDWMLAEAAHLIKIAQLQLSLQKDKTTAIQLLKSADALIVEMADSSLLPIRKALAKDISDISLIIGVDAAGISVALNAISQQIPNLDIVALELSGLEGHTFDPNSSITNDKTPTENAFGLTTIYRKFLDDFVVIKDHSEPIKPLMTPDQRANLTSNIQLAIQQAQIALAMSDETLYQLNLNNAILWSKEFFIQNRKTKLVVKQLEEQKNKVVDVRYPDQLAAKQALDLISRQQLYKWLDASSSSRLLSTTSPNKKLSGAGISQEKVPKTTSQQPVLQQSIPEQVDSVKNNDQNTNDGQQLKLKSNKNNDVLNDDSRNENNSQPLESEPLESEPLGSKPLESEQ